MEKLGFTNLICVIIKQKILNLKSNLLRTKMKIPVYIADLTHTNGGIMALTHPLGTAYVAAYCQEMLKNIFDISLFKFPVDLIKKINKKTPKILAFSNYSWNIELSYEIAKWV